MSEDEEAEKRKRKKEVGMDVGRMLGILAREDPEFYTALKQYAESNGLELHEATIMLLKKQILYQRIQYTNINIEQLMSAWDILKELIHYSIQLYTSMSGIFFSEMTRAYSELIESKLKEIQETKAPQPVEVDSRLKQKLLDILEPMLDSMVEMSFRAMGMKIPDNMKVKVPVKIEVLGEKAEEQKEKVEEENKEVKNSV
jgi:hypothetical protein